MMPYEPDESERRVIAQARWDAQAYHRAGVMPAARALDKFAHKIEQGYHRP